MKLLRVDGALFKDLNKNGVLDVYEDWRRPVAERATDLVAQMTLEEKAGLMVGPSLVMGPNGMPSEQPTYGVNPFSGGPAALVSPATTDALTKRHIVQFINRENRDPRTMATWLNAVQQLAEGRRLGTPVLFVTNPRNHYGAAATFGIAEATSAFSQWPGTLGLAATRDAALVEEFARVAAQEYVSVGIRGAYHPTADVATEPRWGRFRETFGEDASLTAEMITAVVRGFQGRELGPRSVALTTKHFPGAGPASGGQDAHFAWGKNQVYPGRNLEYHLIPWKAAIEAGTAMIMPYYAVPRGLTSEDVGMAYNKEIVTDLLRGKLGYTGVVNSDTGITTGMPWGVETLSVKERYLKAIQAGVDRLGGDATPELIVELVQAGALPEGRVDESARRILRVLFALGLFEDPYANPEEAARTVRNAEFQQKADLAQRKSIVLLKNAGAPAAPEEGRPPLRRGRRRLGGGAVRLRLDRKPRRRRRVRRARLRRERPELLREALRGAHRPDPARDDAHARACPDAKEADRRRAAPRQPPGRARAREGSRRAPRHVRGERRGAPRRAVRAIRADRPAPVRDALVDGRRARTARGRPSRLESPALRDRVRADLPLGPLRRSPHPGGASLR